MRSNNEILEQVIKDTEKIFSRIAVNYPALLTEIESGIAKASVAISNLSVIDDASIDSYLERHREESKRNLKELGELKEKNRHIIDKLSGAIDEYQESQAYIDEIRDISESLQIVSINALVNAVKSGKGGEGFSVITENLKTVTGATIEKTGVLEKKGQAVKKQLNVFYEAEKEISESRRIMLESLEEKVIRSIDTFQQEAETVNGLLSGLNSETEEVKRSIQVIMQELQQQDIIKQTIDQIIISMKELPKECEECRTIEELTDEKMDKAVFCIRITDISLMMIDEVVGRLDKTIKVFSENFAMAESKLEYIENEKDEAVDRFVNSLTATEELSGVNLEIRSSVSELTEKRKKLISIIADAIVIVKSTTDEIEAFGNISDTLQNIAVLSRIELTRSASLTHMSESVDDMAELVERIHQQIAEGEKETGEFIKKTESTFEEYDVYAEGEQRFLGEFSVDFQRSINEINRMTTSFSTVLKEFDFFSDEFRSLFDISTGELEQLKSLTDHLHEVSANLDLVKIELHPIVQKRLGGKDIRSWDITDKSLNEIINRFTIYSHKKSAGEMSGLVVEKSAAEEGEVTLF